MEPFQSGVSRTRHRGAELPMSARDRQPPQSGGRLGKIVIECGHRPRVAFAERGGADGVRSTSEDSMPAATINSGTTPAAALTSSMVDRTAWISDPDPSERTASRTPRPPGAPWPGLGFPSGASPGCWSCRGPDPRIKYSRKSPCFFLALGAAQGDLGSQVRRPLSFRVTDRHHGVFPRSGLSAGRPLEAGP